MTRVSIPAPEGLLSGYLARPPVGDGPWPGVVVLHEAFGLTTDIKKITDRVASAGYVALAPDLYSWGSTPRCLVATFRAMLRGEGRAFDDIDATRKTLLGRDDTTDKAGVVGFCLGGSFALLTAARGFDVAAPNYGHLPSEPAETLAGACPVVASYGGRDMSLRGAAGKLAEALTDAGVPHDVQEYPGAGHSFMNRHGFGPFGVLERVSGFAYCHDDAEDAWRRIFGYFEAHLR